MFKIIIDANVWIKYARAKNIHPLLNRLTSYNLLPVTNNYLLSEIFDALVLNKWMNAHQARQLITFYKEDYIRFYRKGSFCFKPGSEGSLFI